jgi:hypothetical protein
MTSITVDTQLNVWRINIELPFGTDARVQGYVEAVLTQADAPIGRSAPAEPGVNITTTTPIDRPAAVTPEVQAAVDTLRDAVLDWLTEDVELARSAKAPQPEPDEPAPASTGKKRTR